MIFSVWICVTDRCERSRSSRREEIEQIAPVMLETFLNSDGAFKRARRDLHQRRKEEA
ncbi:MAG: DUF2274 domain-containing protein [Pseudomonadota bacterium]